MARIFKTPFGAQGDTEQVPEAPQGDGSVSLTQGFGYDYEREYEDPAAKDIRREVMNGLFHDVTEAIGDIQLSGVAKWDADASPYPAGAIVWHNSAAWLSRVGNNSDEPSEGASWTAVATSVNSVQTSGNQTISGVKTFSSFPVTPSAAPTADYQAANKKYVDDKTISQPSTSGSITLNGTTDNAVVMSGIVTELDLEIGDVIRIDTGAYNKLHTVESITDNDSIIVNYEHAGNRADGSLKLPDFTGQATVTRVAKWFNAPVGLGQAWVEVTGSRVVGVNYTTPTNRSMQISILANTTSSVNFIASNGAKIGEFRTTGGVSFAVINPDGSYIVNTGLGTTIVYISELR